MRKLALLAATAVVIAGCAGQTPGQQVATGALVGGAAGAGAGQLIGGSTGATVVGGILGAGAGSMIGASAANRQHWCTDYDEYGRAYRYQC